MQQWISVVIYLAGMGVGLGVLHLWLWRTQRARRQTPLTRNLLRGPGQSLRAAIDDLTFDLVAYFGMLSGVPLLFYAMYLERRLLGASKPVVEIALAVTLVIVVAYIIRKLVRTLSRLRRLRLGLEGEMAAGQELDQLMLEGYRVFHDVPGNGFNIDHVVVGRNGVFAIETKTRSKPLKDDGKAERHVEYTGGALIFPHYRSTKPLAQAEYQAKWMHEWLSAAVGKSVLVMPLVALPGWYINRGEHTRIPVFNPLKCAAYFRHVGTAELSHDLQQQIAHQLDQRCRDVAPRAYPRKKTLRMPDTSFRGVVAVRRRADHSVAVHEWRPLVRRW